MRPYVPVMPLSYRLSRIAPAYAPGNLHPAAAVDVPQLEDPPRKGVVYFRNIAP